MQVQQREEMVNALTHGVGVIAGIAVLSVLVTVAALRGDAWDVVGTAVFGASVVLLYLASTLYHSARRPHIKARLKVFDHSAIYVLIAGSYTPFMIGALRGAWGWSLFGVIWGLAVAGIIFKLFFTGRFKLASTIIYIGMGWLAVIAIGPMIRLLTPATLAWIVAGGIAYTVGTPFYHSRVRYAHSIWHLFVLAGTACHAIAVGIHI